MNELSGLSDYLTEYSIICLTSPGLTMNHLRAHPSNEYIFKPLLTFVSPEQEIMHHSILIYKGSAMKKTLIVSALSLIGLLSITTALSAQCGPDLSVYGFGSPPAGKNSYGEIVGAAGDVNNDGFQDFLVATTRYHFTVDATVTVYSGITGDSIRTYYRSSNTVHGASYFGDYNNDQYDDLLINGVIYSGLDGDTLKKFPSSVWNGISAGDVDGDGAHDIIDPDYGYSGGRGRVDLLSGSTGDTLQSWFGHGTLFRFGQVVDAAGDFDNDGTIDIIIGEPESDASGTDRGAAFVYSGKDGSELFRRLGLKNHTKFGSAVSGAGDLDNDGFDDIIVSSLAYSIYNDSAKVWAYSGQTGALLYTVAQGSMTDKFGACIDALGDISNDGYDDFVVGASWYANRKGNLYIFSGESGELLYESYSRFTPNVTVGVSVAGVGDTDGDGSPDFVSGSPQGHDPDNPDANNTYRGSAHLFRCTFPSWECQRYVDFDHDMWSNVCDNCKWFPNIDQLDTDLDGLGDMCDDSSFVRTGHSRYVQFSRANWEWTGTYPRLVFDSVSAEAPAYLTLTPLHEPIDGIRKIPFQGPMKYTFTTDANFEGTITVTLPYLDTNLTVPMEEELKLLQKVDGVWRNITTIAAAPLYNRIVGETYSLGEFAIGGCLNATDSDSDGFGDICDNCPFEYNPDQLDANGNGIGDVCESSQPVSPGPSIEADLTAAGDTVKLSFAMVDQAGDVELTVSPNGPASGPNFGLFPADPPKYYDISTDALFSGDIIVTLSYDDAGMTTDEENALALWHFENNEWVDITDSHNKTLNTITGITTSLSPFTFGLSDLPTAVEEETPATLPGSFQLGQNYPNPFNPRTVVDYTVPKRSQVTIEIYNIIGQKVMTLVDAEQSAGEYQVTWNGNDATGQKVSSGMYLYRFKAGEYTETKKMLLLK